MDDCKDLFILDDEYKVISPNKWNIREICATLDLKKYDKIIYDFKSVEVDYDDALNFIEKREKCSNILVKICLDYLICCNKSTYHKSDLCNDIDKLLSFYFNDINNNHGGLFVDSILRVIKFCAFKFPNHKDNIKTFLLDSFLNCTNDFIDVDSFIFRIAEDSTLNSLFSKTEYDSILFELTKRNMNNDALFYFDFLNIILNLCSNEKKNKCKKVITDLTLYNLDNLSSDFKLKNLSNVRRYMDKLNKYSDEDYNLIDLEIEKVIKTMESKMNYTKVFLPDDINEKIINDLKGKNDAINDLSSYELFSILLLQCRIISKSELNDELKQETSFFSSLFRKGITINSDTNTIIDRDSLSDKENDIIELFDVLKRKIQVQFLFIRQILDKMINDETIKKIIKRIITNNELVDNSRSLIVCERFNDFFDKRYNSSVPLIVMDLEESLRFYFKNCGLSIHKRNGRDDVILTSDIFNFSENNMYRDKLLEVIDEDFYFNITLLIANDYGFNLRAKCAHAIGQPSIYGDDLSIYSCLLILLLYAAFERNN